MNYKVFFDALRKQLFFESKKGNISLYELFTLPESDLKELYKTLKRKVETEDDPLLNELSSTTNNSDDQLRFETVKAVLKYRIEERKKTELLKKKEQLEHRLREIEIEKLMNDPEKIKEELNKLTELLSSD